MSLKRLQSDFARALKSEKEAAPLSLVGSFEVYREAYRARLLESLRDDFPGLISEVGREAFDQLAKKALRVYPSRYSSLSELGKSLIRYLEQTQNSSSLALLSLARRDWARYQAALADRQEPISMEEMLQLNEEDWLTGSFVFQKSLQLVPSADSPKAWLIFWSPGEGLQERKLCEQEACFYKKLLEEGASVLEVSDWMKPEDLQKEFCFMSRHALIRKLDRQENRN